jgi:methionyl-tRNA formyltransferase
MRVLVLTNPQPNQAALVRKLTLECQVVGVVLSENIPRRPPKHRIRRWANRIAGRTVGRPLVSAWLKMLQRYDREGAGFPAVPQIKVANVNDRPVLNAIHELAPDLVAVSGTNLVDRPVIEACAQRRGIVNLHTGISPQVKGGPNCTNWCLARGWFHLIGNTVMWLDAGIDSGNLIATERTPLTGRETLEELHWKVMEHAHDLYVRAISAIGAGWRVPNVPQHEVGKGPTFRNADWTALEMLRARRNFRRRYPRDMVASRHSVSLVSLDDLSRIVPAAEQAQEEHKKAGEDGLAEDRGSRGGAAE